jgi:hypothetical protein
VTAKLADVDEPLLAWTRELERQVVEMVVAEPERFYKKAPGAQEIRDAFVSCLQESEDRPPLLKTKLCLAECDKGGVRCWGADRQRCDRPEHWKGQRIAPSLWFARLYFANTGWGLVVELADAMLLGAVEREAACPWDDLDL